MAALLEEGYAAFCPIKKDEKDGVKSLLLTKIADSQIMSSALSIIKI